MPTDPRSDPRGGLSDGRRVIADACAVADLGLRTALATMVGATALPRMATRGAALALGRTTADDPAERAALRHYAELADAADPATSFPPPGDAPRVATRPADPLSGLLAGGIVENVTFRSSFRAIWPGARDRHRRHRRNGVVHAQHWRHGDGPHPTLLVLNGAAFPATGLFLGLPAFYRAGYDVMLMTLPFHGRRAESPLPTATPFPDGPGGAAESTAQALHDLRSLIDHLEYTGVDRIAVTGASLGGRIAALAAAVEERVTAVVPITPLVGPAARGWFPANLALRARERLDGADADSELLAAAARFHSPLTYRPLVAPRRRMIVAGVGDRLAPPADVERLREHWDGCAVHWFPGGHVLHVDQPDYLRRTARFLAPFMF